MAENPTFTMELRGHQVQFEPKARVEENGTFREPRDGEGAEFYMVSQPMRFKGVEQEMVLIAAPDGSQLFVADPANGRVPEGTPDLSSQLSEVEKEGLRRGSQEVLLQMAYNPDLDFTKPGAKDEVREQLHAAAVAGAEPNFYDFADDREANRLAAREAQSGGRG
ncbi:MAG: hypothetical protein GC134_02070 [Proteobacteria bacterium]|nr:hypothetical protein [Pseudomonadota bacterium]